MSEPKWTPGPWVVEARPDQRAYVRVPDGVLADATVAVVYKRAAGERDANAHLIAAAPDLYEALKGALRAIETVGETLGDMDAMRAALAKARGEQS